MRLLKALILFCVLVNNSLFGQVGVGEWMDHFAMKDVTKIVSYNQYIYGATSSGLIVYDKSQNLISKVTKANGLSDSQVSSFAVDKKGTLVIGYSNGNIDILENGIKTNIRDLFIKSMKISKKINEIFIYKDRAYLSCEFGILVINITKKEVADTYVLSSTSEVNSVNNTIIQDSIIYSATSNGVFSSSLKNSRIQIFSSWNQVSEDNLSYSDLTFYNDGLFVIKGNKDESCLLVMYKNGSLATLMSFPSFRQITSSEHLLITDRSSLSIIDSSNNVIKTISAGANQFLCANEIKNTFYSGKVGHGMIMFNDLLTNEDQNEDILPNGPYSNSIFDIKSTSYGVWVTPGGLTPSWNNQGIEPYLSFYNNGYWENFSKVKFPEFSGEWDLLRIAINSKKPSAISICSWGSGIFEVQQNQTLTHYDQHNSALKNIYDDDNNYVRVGGIAIDANGATWMTNSGIPSGGLVVKSIENNWYTYDYAITSNQHSQGQICVTKNNFKWSFFPLVNPVQSGIFVWDDNGTISNASDDRYRGPANRTTDYRNKGELRLWNSDKTVITNSVNCLAEDKSGALWVGTDKGPLVYYRPSSIFDEQYPVATQINIPRNDGSGLGDYLLGQEEITSIAIDDANRKWFGTATSGVYLISADGTIQLEHFNIDNSPLPSNSIIAINYEEKSGQIFIGTALGLVSYKGTAVQSSTDNSSPYVFPNPVNPGFNGLITVKGIMTDSNVKVTDVSGNLVNELKSLGGQAVWDGKNFNGERVSSGIYFFLITNSDGSESGKTKVLIVN